MVVRPEWWWPAPAAVVVAPFAAGRGAAAFGVPAVRLRPATPITARATVASVAIFLICPLGRPQNCASESSASQAGDLRGGAPGGYALTANGGYWSVSRPT